METTMNRRYGSCAATRMAAATLTLAWMADALAAEPAVTGTLDKIRIEHAVTIGYRDASIPLSYYDAQQKPIGYSIDFANLIVERIKSQLKLSELTVRMIPITSQNRISLLQNGTIDF